MGLCKDYGMICASSITGCVFYGKNGTILWKDQELTKPKPKPIPPIPPIGMPCHITISWSDSSGDLDVCAFWTASMGTVRSDDNSNVGWSWSNSHQTKNINGYIDTWDGDNTSGGPEYIDIDCEDHGNINDTFEVRCNWYRGHGTATLHIMDNEGNELIDTIHPSEDNQGSKAMPTDHGFKLHFSQDGVLERIETV